MLPKHPELDDNEEEDDLEGYEEGERSLVGPRVYGVSEALALAKAVLSENLGLVAIRGQISGLTFAASGHWYFKLKDSSGLLDSVIFRNSQRGITFRPANDMEVTSWGRLDLYARSGRFQFVVERLERHQGLGDLALAFLKLQERLRAEGLFDASRKRPLPLYPRRIGLITSATGAAIQDLLTVLGRRSPSTAVLLAPCKVQGEGAAEDIVAKIHLLNRQTDVDLIIVGRGGGDINDLWAFNEEIVARAIAASRLPILTGIGHESDTTIADLAADLRAATPSAAAEIAVLNRTDLASEIQHLHARLSRTFENRVSESRLAFESLHNRLLSQDPKSRIIRFRERVTALHDLLHLHTSEHLRRRRLELFARLAQLDALSPFRVLQRGYSLILDDAGNLVRDAKDLSPASSVRLRFAKGEATAIIQSLTTEADSEPPA